jgi:hypothetical protein
LLMGGKATIAAAGRPIVGAPRIIDLGTRTGREARRGHEQRNNEPNRFRHLHGSPPCLLGTIMTHAVTKGEHKLLNFFIFNFLGTNVGPLRKS